MTVRGTPARSMMEACVTGLVVVCRGSGSGDRMRWRIVIRLCGDGTGCGEGRGGVGGMRNIGGGTGGRR
jgi:hypothetical protein